MMNAELVKKMVTGKRVLISLMIYYSFFVIMYLPFSPVSRMILKHIPVERVLDLQKTGYSEMEAEAFLHDLGELGRSAYIRNLWTVDLVFPFLAAISSIALILYCVYRIRGKSYLSLLVLVPVSVAVLDYAENILITISTLTYPDSMSTIVRVASVCTRLKWIGISMGSLISVVLLLLLLFVIILRKIGAGKNIPLS